MAKIKKAKKAKTNNAGKKSVNTKKAPKMLLKDSIKEKHDLLIFKINTLKKRGYFPYLIIVLILLSIVYLGRGLLFAAIVDGKPITRISLIRELEKQAGKEALNSLITKEMINQEAKKMKIKVSDTEIVSEIERISLLLKDQGTDLDSALLMQGISMDDFKDNLKMQITAEKLVGDKVSISDDEVNKYYENNKAMYGESVKFEDIKDSLKDQLIQDKLSSEFQLLLEKIQSETNIKYLIDFK